MSWLGVAPLKKFPAPFRTAPSPRPGAAPEPSRVFLLTAIQTRSEALLALFRCRYVMRKCYPEYYDNDSLGSATQSQKMTRNAGWGDRSRDGGETLLTRLAGAVIAYGANSAQNAMMASDEWKNDPRNPNAKTAGGH
ncbi:hypothetical protein LLEC1_07884 [Akanthomyces lecanii]|uniref:Uncharacterized protein n=1 Tax=Cordyceps confragosa TaxID=2714763 RepID=A0A179I1H5_CORDF|nr:hypothetical protein LLEC1_07884 [Akanthomyces lecanii]